MTLFLWTMALTCWSTAALLVVSMIYPDLFRWVRLSGLNDSADRGCQAPAGAAVAER
jgi:hypothetical protein